MQFFGESNSNSRIDPILSSQLPEEESETPSQRVTVIMCTLEKRGSFFIITFTGDDQHRLNPTLIASLLSTLRQVRSQAAPGTVLITTNHGRFFSNGFDLAWASAASSAPDGGSSKSTPVDRLALMVNQFKDVAAELISFPIPTIAAVHGHAAASGFLLALSHDYILMRSDRGVLYMSEVDIGMTLPDYFSALFAAKLVSASVRRDILLFARKVKGAEAVEMGIVDEAHDSEGSLVEATMRLGDQLAKRKWHPEVYKEIRKSLYPGLCPMLGLGEAKKVVVAKL